MRRLYNSRRPLVQEFAQTMLHSKTSATLVWLSESWIGYFEVSTDKKLANTTLRTHQGADRHYASISISRPSQHQFQT